MSSCSHGHRFANLAEFERAIIRERPPAGLDDARARGRNGGRPPALTAGDLIVAKALLADPAFTIEEVARQLCVAPSTLYHHFRDRPSTPAVTALRGHD